MDCEYCRHRFCFIVTLFFFVFNMITTGEHHFLPWELTIPRINEPQWFAMLNSNIIQMNYAGRQFYFFRKTQKDWEISLVALSPQETSWPEIGSHFIYVEPSPYRYCGSYCYTVLWTWQANKYKYRSHTEERNNKCNPNRRNDECCPQENETPETIRDSDRKQFLDTSCKWVHQQGIFVHCQGSKQEYTPIQKKKEKQTRVYIICWKTW